MIKLLQGVNPLLLLLIATTLEVSGEQRVVLQVPASGDALTFKLEPGVYTPKSQALSLRWGP